MGTETEILRTETKAASRRSGRSRSAHPRSRALGSPAEPLPRPAPVLVAETGEATQQSVPEQPEARQEPGLIVLSGAVEIGQAAELKRRFQEALTGGGDLRASLAAVTELDVTAVQLLWAAGRAARAAGVRFEIAAPRPAEMMAALAEAGLDGVLNAV
jgi:ABC-type transporter Mla MlaB component